MDTKITKEENGKRYNQHNQEVIPCRICRGDTAALETALCDRCLELEIRIRSDPELYKKIIMEIESEKWHKEREKQRTINKIINNI
jgi:hypothetical protein